MLGRLAALAAWARARARAQGGVITLLVPWPAGGATDITLRLLAELAGPLLAQKIIIENKPGAGGSLAMPLLQQAPADGSVLAQLPYPVLRLPFIQKVGWDPLRDTSPILQLSGVSFGILVAADSPGSSWPSCSTTRSATGALSVATNGTGTRRTG
jgi:tripartite-type tricarboxylate transporter receptor subunit TctC